MNLASKDGWNIIRKVFASMFRRKYFNACTTNSTNAKHVLYILLDNSVYDAVGNSRRQDSNSGRYADKSSNIDNIVSYNLEERAVVYNPMVISKSPERFEGFEPQ